MTLRILGQIGDTTDDLNSADLLYGYASFTANATASLLLTVPAGRTWEGSFFASVSAAEAAAGTALAEASVTFATAGIGVVPAAGTYWGIPCLAAQNASGGTVGTDDANSDTIEIPGITAPPGNSVTVTVTVTISGTAGRVDASAVGGLIPQ